MMRALETIHRWDVFAFERIVTSHLRRTLIDAARVLSRTGDGWAYPIVPLILYLSGVHSAAMFLEIFGIAFVIERLMYLVGKRGFKRRRPANVVPGFQSRIVASDEFSFPSGHTSAAFLMVTLLVVFYGPYFIPFYIWACGVGASRVILGVHFPTDIAVGSLMGSCIGIAVASWLTAT